MSETIKSTNGESNENTNTGWENMEEARKPETLRRAINVSSGDIARSITGNYSIDKVIPILEELSQKNNGNPVETVFKKHVIRSDMSEDEMYLEVFGHIKNPEDQQALKLAEQKRGKMLDKAEASTNINVDYGKIFIYTEKQKEWEEFVTSGARDLYFGKNLDRAISIMTNLEHEPDFKKIDESIKESVVNEGINPEAILETVFLFSKKGPEFYQWLLEDRGNLTKEKHKKIAEQKLKNAQMELHDIELNGQ